MENLLDLFSDIENKQAKVDDLLDVIFLVNDYLSEMTGGTGGEKQRLRLSNNLNTLIDMGEQLSKEIHCATDKLWKFLVRKSFADAKPSASNLCS